MTTTTACLASDLTLVAAARRYLAARDEAAPGGYASSTMVRIALDRELGRVLEANERGVLIELAHDGGFLMAADDDEAPRLASLCARPGCGVALADARHSALFNTGGQTPFVCNTYIYLGDPKPVSLPDERGRASIAGLDLRRLDESFADVVCAHYDIIGPQFVREHLRAGQMYGGFTESGELVGFIGEHEEGSIGMLRVFPEYRRRGCAQALESLMINLHLARGYLPYCQVALDNEASHALQAKLGFTRVPGEQCWVDVA